MTFDYTKNGNASTRNIYPNGQLEGASTTSASGYAHFTIMSRSVHANEPPGSRFSAASQGAVACDAPDVPTEPPFDYWSIRFCKWVAQNREMGGS